MEMTEVYINIIGIDQIGHENLLIFNFRIFTINIIFFLKKMERKRIGA